MMLKVMTFNLNYTVDKHGTWLARRELIREAIRSARPDVIALQAVRKDPKAYYGLDQASQISELLPEFRHVVFQPAISYPDGSEDGSAILSQIEIDQIDYLRLSLVPGLEDPNPRILIHSLFRQASGPFHLFNAHFSWVGEQTRANLDETLPYLDSFSGAALLTGDLNTPAGSDLLDRMSQAGWVDLWAELHPGEPGYTFEAGKPSIRIDYAWANRDLMPYVREIEIVADSSSEAGAHPSDHTGLMVTLDLE